MPAEVDEFDVRDVCATAMPTQPQVLAPAWPFSFSTFPRRPPALSPHRRKREKERERERERETERRERETERKERERERREEGQGHRQDPLPLPFDLTVFAVWR